MTNDEMAALLADGRGVEGTEAPAEVPTPRINARPARREVAYNAIDSERDYQNQRWNPFGNHDAAGCDPHTPIEWLAYMDRYVARGIAASMDTADQEEATLAALEFIRKVGALAVVALEQHGAPQRAGYER